MAAAVVALLAAAGVLAHCPASGHGSCGGGFAPAAPPAAAESHPCASEAACRTGLADWQVWRVLHQHNTYRRNHGACPVAYSRGIEGDILRSEGFDTMCSTGQATRNTASDYGENIAMVGRPNLTSSAWDPAEGVKNWYCMEEGCYDYSNGGYSGQTGHFTQVVWKASLEIGCGVCHTPPKSPGDVPRAFLMCGYRSGGAGSPGAAYASNVLPPGSSSLGCVVPTAAPRVDECRANPCGPRQLCNDPNQAADALGDYSCHCDSGASRVGSPASCDGSECYTGLCGSHASCQDPDTTKDGDFICTCFAGSNGTSVGEPVVCAVDECAENPCGVGQMCFDPNMTWDAARDFICTCPFSGAGAPQAATGHRAECHPPARNLTAAAEDSESGEPLPVYLWVLGAVSVVFAACAIGLYLVWGQQDMLMFADDFFDIEEGGSSTVSLLQTDYSSTADGHP